jgi:hypothetical protein
MSINLLEAVQQNLGYPVLQKIDPNTELVEENNKTPDEDKFSQAAIPAVLTGLYKYVQTDEGATAFLNAGNENNWVNKIFDDKRKEAVQTISAYAHQSKQDPVAKMNAIANEAVKVVKENLSATPEAKEVKTFFANQKSNILLYLPTALHMGELLHDNTLDDNTNKMEGPISSLMNSIGAAFSSPVTDDEVKKP